MTAPRGPLFLERQVYRRRRLADAARVLPVAGLVALVLPVLWSAGGGMSTASEAVYLFALWFLLILAAALLSRPLREAQEREAQTLNERPEDAAPPPEAHGPSRQATGGEDGP